MIGPFILHPNAKLIVVDPGAMIGRFSTDTENEHVAVLFEASRAVHVTLVTPIGFPEAKYEPLGGVQVYVTYGQLSVTFVGVNVTVAPLHVASDSTEMFAGQIIVGGCASTTVTEKLHAAELPDASETVHDTVVVPRGNVVPLGGEQLGVPTPGQLSETVGADHVTTEVQTLGSVFFVMLDGQVIVGGCASFTVMVKAHDAVLLEASVAVHVTVVTPFGNCDPVGGLHTTVTPGQLSVPVAVNVTTA